MDLYYSPMACSLAARIVCAEGGLAVTMRRADLESKRVDGDVDGALLRLNAMGKVPALVLDDGTVLTENVAVLLYLGDRADPTRAGRRLTPPEGTTARYELVRWLSFVATELHKRVLATVYSLDRPADAVKEFARRSATQPLGALEEHLCGRHGRDGLVAGGFTVADAYLLWALLLLPRPQCAVSLDPYPAVRAYFERGVRRDPVRAAIAQEMEEYRRPGWWTASRLAEATSGAPPRP